MVMVLVWSLSEASWVTVGRSLIHSRPEWAPP